MSYSTWEDYGHSQPVQISKNEEEKVMEIISGQHKKKILSEYELCIILVYGKWCGPCKVFKPKFFEFAKQNMGLGSFAIEDVDLGLTNGVSAVPTIVVYIRSQPVKFIVGASLAELTPFLERQKKRVQHQ